LNRRKRASCETLKKKEGGNITAGKMKKRDHCEQGALDERQAIAMGRCKKM